MSWWSRVMNVIRGDRLIRELDEELESHLEQAIEAGRDPAEARRAFGSLLRHRECSRDLKVVPWLDSLRSDAVFGWRQIKKRKVTSAAAILSLALAMGACTSAFRLIDAMLLRPLPVAAPERLYALARQGLGPDGMLHTGDSWAYPAFLQMRAAVTNQAELLAISYAERTDLTFTSDQEMEKAYVQYVSGWMFGAFGLRPALGRLLMEEDDRVPRAHPYAVLSYDYWARHFGRDEQVLGRTFRMGENVYEIIGVAPKPFTGTEPGTVTDVFVPTMMHPGVTHSDWTWFRTLVQVKPGEPVEAVRATLHGVSRAFEEERAKGVNGIPKEMIARFLDRATVLEPAVAGVSGMQREYRRSLAALGALVGLVLSIACANVANLLTAQAASRAREMALRVSIGAGRWRLVQLVLIESAWLAFLAAAGGTLFAAWSAPFVVSMINPTDNPARLPLPTDWRVLGFGLTATLLVTLLFGLAPALRAAAVRPANALKGGEDPRARHRLMHSLIGAQVAFCVLVLFIAGLFVASFGHLASRPIGFSAKRLITLDTVARGSQPAIVWEQVAQHLREIPGVESVTLAGWPLLRGVSWSGFVSANGAPPSSVLAAFLNVSPGWLDTMKIRLVEGRDLRPADRCPGSAIVNESFAKEFFNGESPLGKSFEKGELRFTVVGVAGDVPYRNMRDPVPPQAYVPFDSVDGKGVSQPKGDGTFIVRTSNPNPLPLASILRQEVGRARAEFRVSNIRTQLEINQSHTIRERLLARLASFFALVALVLAGIGVYGVLDFAVLQKRREIGIRMALGARACHIVKGVAAEVFSMLVVGALAGLALGLGSLRYVDALLYEVKGTDLPMLALPWMAILAVALLAALPPVIRAVRIDPVRTLRAE